MLRNLTLFFAESFNEFLGFRHAPGIPHLKGLPMTEYCINHIINRFLTLKGSE